MLIATSTFLQDSLIKVDMYKLKGRKNYVYLHKIKTQILNLNIEREKIKVIICIILNFKK